MPDYTDSSVVRTHKSAAKNIKKVIRSDYRGEIAKYSVAEIVCAILVGAGVTTYLGLKGIEPIATEGIGNVTNLPGLGAFLQEARAFVQEKVIPNIKNLPELWNAIKSENIMEHVTVAATALIAGAGAWYNHKRAEAIRDRNDEIKEELGKLRGH